ncbi:hypothetical protein RFI_10837 [Reticulomyxa filosa]|uniref:Uncharacterized protein n=1 Tax=Reticulomyxa filosa TaxID=46433 RepID=X6NLP1_RETFI|nr:hypothetical protein RFI_10837 [Reticulomyxa filosa]|eukprot:ETO26302.1 hypothetical protein RFI_10837 [Reticulomyxa filosa]
MWFEAQQELQQGKVPAVVLKNKTSLKNVGRPQKTPVTTKTLQKVIDQSSSKGKQAVDDDGDDVSDEEDDEINDEVNDDSPNEVHRENGYYSDEKQEENDIEHVITAEVVENVTIGIVGKGCCVIT